VNERLFEFVSGYCVASIGALLGFIFFWKSGVSGVIVPYAVVFSVIFGGALRLGFLKIWGEFKSTMKGQQS